VTVWQSMTARKASSWRIFTGKHPIIECYGL
jgi:hypothetical protein